MKRSHSSRFGNDRRNGRRLTVERCEERIVLSSTATVADAHAEQGGFIAVNPSGMIALDAVNFVQVKDGASFFSSLDRETGDSAQLVLSFGSSPIYRSSKSLDSEAKDASGEVDVQATDLEFHAGGQAIEGLQPASNVIIVRAALDELDVILDSSNDLFLGSTTSSLGRSEATERLAEAAKLEFFESEEGLRSETVAAASMVAEEFDPVFAQEGNPQHENSSTRHGEDDASTISPAPTASASITDELPRWAILLTSWDAPESVDRTRTELIENTSAAAPQPPPANAAEGGPVDVLLAVAQTQRALSAELLAPIGPSPDKVAIAAGASPTDKPLTSEMARAIAFELAGGGTSHRLDIENVDSLHDGADRDFSTQPVSSHSARALGDSNEHERELAFARWPLALAASTGALLYDHWRRKQTDAEQAGQQQPRRSGLAESSLDRHDA